MHEVHSDTDVVDINVVRLQALQYAIDELRLELAREAIHPSLPEQASADARVEWSFAMGQFDRLLCLTTTASWRGDDALATYRAMRQALENVCRICRTLSDPPRPATRSCAIQALAARVVLRLLRPILRTG